MKNQAGERGGREQDHAVLIRLLDEDDLLIIGRKMLNALKKSHEVRDKPPEEPNKADIAAVEADKKDGGDR